MVGRLESLTGYQRDNLYFHSTFAPEKLVALGRSLEEGFPLLTLRGRATLCRGEAALGRSTEGRGMNLIFRIAEAEQESLVQPIHRSPFEHDDAASFPDWFTFVMACDPVFADMALKWIEEQKAHNPFWRGFGRVGIGDVRMLPTQCFLGIY
ncbi:MAG: hypothetical protein WAV40_04380 [Microgenomates group bacterium]